MFSRYRKLLDRIIIIRDELNIYDSIEDELCLHLIDACIHTSLPFQLIENIIDEFDTFHSRKIGQEKFKLDRWFQFIEKIQAYNYSALAKVFLSIGILLLLTSITGLITFPLFPLLIGALYFKLAMALSVAGAVGGISSIFSSSLFFSKHNYNRNLGNKMVRLVGKNSPTEDLADYLTEGKLKLIK